MDLRGPPEGAPVNSFEISISDNWPTDSLSISMCEQKKMNNNKLLFLTVSKFFEGYILRNDI